MFTEVMLHGKTLHALLAKIRLRFAVNCTDVPGKASTTELLQAVRTLYVTVVFRDAVISRSVERIVTVKSCGFSLFSC